MCEPGCFLVNGNNQSDEEHEFLLCSQGSRRQNQASRRQAISNSQAATLHSARYSQALGAAMCTAEACVVEGYQFMWRLLHMDLKFEGSDGRSNSVGSQHMITIEGNCRLVCIAVTLMLYQALTGTTLGLAYGQLISCMS
jgi:hypothetical protein